MRTLSQSSAVYWQRTASLDWGDGGGKATNDRRRTDDKKRPGRRLCLHVNKTVCGSLIKLYFWKWIGAHNHGITSSNFIYPTWKKTGEGSKFEVSELSHGPKDPVWPFQVLILLPLYTPIKNAKSASNVILSIPRGKTNK